MNKTVSTEKLSAFLIENKEWIDFLGDTKYGIGLDKLVDAIQSGNLSPDPDPDIKEVCERWTPKSDCKVILEILGDTKGEAEAADLSVGLYPAQDVAEDLEHLINYVNNHISISRSIG